jgi:hypothetical protein
MSVQGYAKLGRDPSLVATNVFVDGYSSLISS